MFPNGFLFLLLEISWLKHDNNLVIKYSCRAGVGHLIAQNVCSRYFHKKKPSQQSLSIKIAS